MKHPILILHGWGSEMSGKRYKKVKSLLEKRGFTVLAPDLPGFGSNTIKKEELFFSDYVAFVKSYIEEQKLKKVILLGHSFGGRIAIAFAALYPQYVVKLILVAASGIPHPLPSLKKKVMYTITKIAKPFFSLPGISIFYIYFRKMVYYSLGEMDYYKAGSLRKTFTNVYQINVVDYLSKIKMPTLIIWGKEDIFVPVADGILMHGKIQKSKLIIKENEGHRFPYEKPVDFVISLLPFLIHE